MLLFHLDRQLGMGVAITLRTESQNKRCDDKADNAFLFGREDEFVSQFLPTPTFGEFQRASRFLPGRTRRDG